MAFVEIPNDYKRFVTSCREMGVDPWEFNLKRSDCLLIYLKYTRRIMQDDIPYLCQRVDDIISSIRGHVSSDYFGFSEPELRKCNVLKEDIPFAIKWMEKMMHHWAHDSVMHDRSGSFTQAMQYMKNLSDFVRAYDDVLTNRGHRDIPRKTALNRLSTIAPDPVRVKSIIGCIQMCLSPVKANDGGSVPFERYMADVLIAEMSRIVPTPK